MNLRDLALRIRALFLPSRVERELDDELSFHLECETRKLVASGLPEPEARRRAAARFGPVPRVADECRDARGIAVLDTLARDTRYACRSLRRTPLLALTVVATIALGLGVVTVAFTFFNAIFFREDAVRKPGELFAVERPTRPGGLDEIPFTRGEFRALRRDTTVFVEVAAVRGSMATRIDGRPARGTFVSGTFFDMLGVAAERGRTLTEADNDGGGRAVIVLSHRGWEKLFDRDPSVVGRQLLLNGRPYEVAGVMPKGFRGLTQEPQDYWVPLAKVDSFGLSGDPAQTWVEVVGRLKPNLSPEAAAAALTAWGSAQADAPRTEKAMVPFILRESRGVLSRDRGTAMAVFTPVLFAFGLILLIGCANVANLLLARGLSRHREIGVRLSLGATRGRIVRQLLTESVLLALAAAALGFVVSRALLAGSVYAMLSILPPEFAESLDVVVPPSDWRVLTFLFGGALVSSVLFGLVPALRSTRVEPLRAMRGEMTKESRPSRMRQVLIGSQVTASALLLVCAAVFLRSTYSAATADVGVRTDDTVVVTGITESSRAALLQAVSLHPAVASVAGSWPQPMHGGVTLDAVAGDTKLDVGCKLVTPEYFGLLGIPVLQGRTFAPDERSPESGVVVLSDSVARHFWPRANPLGQSLRLGDARGPGADAEGAPRVPGRAFTVIGVVRDVRSALKLFDFTYSGVYIPTTTGQSQAALLARVHGDPDVARRQLLDALTRVDPALGDITTMRMMARLDAGVLGVAFWMAVILGSLALALTVSGLFGVLSYLVEERRTEIGIRMALGATPGSVMSLVVAQCMRPIGIGVVVGGSLAAGVAALLLATPLAEMMGKFVHAFDPIAYAVGLAVIVATCLVAALIPARRASLVSPTETLRTN